MRWYNGTTTLSVQRGSRFTHAYMHRDVVSLCLIVIAAVFAKRSILLGNLCLQAQQNLEPQAAQGQPQFMWRCCTKQASSLNCLPPGNGIDAGHLNTQRGLFSQCLAADRTALTESISSHQMNSFERDMDPDTIVIQSSKNRGKAPGALGRRRTPITRPEENRRPDKTAPPAISNQARICSRPRKWVRRSQPKKKA